MRRIPPVLAVVCFLVSAPAVAGPLMLDPAKAMLDEPASTGARSLFGAAPGGERSWFATVGAGYAMDRDPGEHADLFLTLSTFLAKEFEAQFEFNAWNFNQPGDNAQGGGVTFNARWHLWHGSAENPDGFDWTIYAEAGIGFILCTDDVPPGGTSLNLSPRAGVGFTRAIGERGARLVAGVRWHHMSNARIFGDRNNPDFNAPLVHIGVQWPLH